MKHDWKNQANKNERLTVAMGASLIVAGFVLALATLAVEAWTGDRSLANLGASVALLGLGWAQVALAFVFFLGRRTNERLQALEEA